MDAIALLKADHQRVAALFERYARCGDSVDSKKAIVDAIREELDLHSRLEEQSFYPLLAQAQSEPVKQLVRHANEEHAIVDQLVSELALVDPDDGRYDAKVKVLQETVERHVAEEQSRIFPQARRWLGDPRLLDLGREMAATKRALQRGVSGQVSDSAGAVTRKLGAVAAAAVRGIRRGLKSGAASQTGRRPRGRAPSSRSAGPPKKTTRRRRR
jgi:hemerythrin-like domain-containing protein